MVTFPQARVATLALLSAILSSAPAWAQRTPTASTIFKNAKPSVVLIIGGNNKGEPTVQGSGFVIGRDQIVTNHHVVEGTSAAMVVFSDGTTEKVTSVIADSSAKDLIVLGVNTGERPLLRLGDEMALKQGILYTRLARQKDSN
jgi:S1-C subfamily serine protease